MPRPHLLRTSDYPYHVFARSNNKEWFSLPIEKVWWIFMHKLAKVQQNLDLKIHCFVLMANHFHMLVSTPQENLDRIMEWLLRETSKAINDRSERMNHIFGGPYKWTSIQDSVHYNFAFRYLAQNPTKAGLVSRVEDYPFSTLYYQNRRLALPIQLSDCEIQKRAIADFPIWTKLDWLNSPFSEAQRNAMQRAMKKAVFQLKQDRKTRKNPFDLSSQR